MKATSRVGLSGKEVFEIETDILRKFLEVKYGYKYAEYKKPDGSIERWWTNEHDSVILRYKDDRKNARHHSHLPIV